MNYLYAPCPLKNLHQEKGTKWASVTPIRIQNAISTVSDMNYKGFYLFFLLHENKKNLQLIEFG